MKHMSLWRQHSRDLFPAIYTKWGSGGEKAAAQLCLFEEQENILW